ncbi:hypothetical protein NHQ30_006199 [Ciborinia camelliae]|nr:hypothetical protein NHQ30_006199 [Ciborinia camelliae]
MGFFSKSKKKEVDVAQATPMKGPQVNLTLSERSAHREAQSTNSPLPKKKVDTKKISAPVNVESSMDFAMAKPKSDAQQVPSPIQGSHQPTSNAVPNVYPTQPTPNRNAFAKGSQSYIQQPHDNGYGPSSGFQQSDHQASRTSPHALNYGDQGSQYPPSRNANHQQSNGGSQSSSQPIASRATHMAPNNGGHQGANQYLTTDQLAGYNDTATCPIQGGAYFNPAQHTGSQLSSGGINESAEDSCNSSICSQISLPPSPTPVNRQGIQHATQQRYQQPSSNSNDSFYFLIDHGLDGEHKLFAPVEVADTNEVPQSDRTHGMAMGRSVREKRS